MNRCTETHFDAMKGHGHTYKFYLNLTLFEEDFKCSDGAKF